MRLEAQATAHPGDGDTGEPLITRHSLSIYFFCLALGIAALLPSLISRTTRDQATVLGRYSTGYAALIVLVATILVIVVLVGVYACRSRSFPVRVERVVKRFWQSPIFGFVLPIVLVATFALTLSFRELFFQRYPIPYPSLLLAGIGTIQFVLVAGLVAPRLAHPAALRFLQNPTLQIIVILVGSAIISVLLFGNILNMQWRMFDDGVTADYLGPDGRVGIEEIPGLVAGSEIGRAFIKTRYRPAFVAVRILETVAWGNNPTLHYLGHFVALVLSTAIFWWLTARALGLIAGGLVILWIFTYSFWFDVWSRLGAAETYALPGVALYLLGLYLLWRYYRGELDLRAYQKRSLWVVYLIGGLLAIGSKENFLLLLIPNAILFFMMLARKRADTAGTFSTIALFTAGLFIASSVGIALLRTGTDIYQNSIAPTSRLAVLLGGLSSLLSNPLLILPALGVILATGLIVLYLRTRGSPAQQEQFRGAIVRFAVFSAGLIVMYLAQVVFYNGDFPTDIRYDFPGRLAGPLLIVNTAWFLLKTLQILGASTLAQNFARFALVALFVGIVLWRGYDLLEDGIAQNVAVSHRYTGELQTVAQGLSSNPNAAVVFESHYFWDHEPVLTTAIFLRTEGIRNPFYVRVHPGKVEPKLPVEFAIQKWLVDASQNGYDWQGGKIFRPLAERTEPECYSIGFSGTTSQECTFLLKIYP